MTDASGWLWAWALAIPETAPDQDAAWEFVSWATGPDYLARPPRTSPVAGQPCPRARASRSTRTPNYQEAAAAFADRTLEAMQAAPIDNPGMQPRPGLPGVQFVGVPQFQDVGTRCTRGVLGGHRRQQVGR